MLLNSACGSFFRLRKRYLQFFRRRKTRLTYEQFKKKSYLRSGVYLFGGWTVLGYLFLRNLFTQTDPTTGQQIFLDPKSARRFSMGIVGDYEAMQVHEESGELVKIRVNPAAIDDD